MQERHFCIEQNPIDARVIYVPRVNLNGREAAAAIEGRITDAGETAGQGNVFQAGASIEGPIPDTGDAVGDRDARQAAAHPIRCW